MKIDKIIKEFWWVVLLFLIPKKKEKQQGSSQVQKQESPSPTIHTKEIVKVPFAVDVEAVERSNDVALSVEDINNKIKLSNPSIVNESHIKYAGVKPVPQKLSEITKPVPSNGVTKKLPVKPESIVNFNTNNVLGNLPSLEKVYRRERRTINRNDNLNTSI